MIIYTQLTMANASSVHQSQKYTLPRFVLCAVTLTDSDIDSSMRLVIGPPDSLHLGLYLLSHAKSPPVAGTPPAPQTQRLTMLSPLPQARNHRDPSPPVAPAARAAAARAHARTQP